MLWHIELKFCIWLCFTVLQTKFECRQFASIFVGVMPLLELRILEIHRFPHFSLPLTYWAESLHITLFFSTTDQVWVSSICVYIGVMPLFELRILSYMLWHIELKFCIWLCFTVLQTKFECRQFASIFVGVMPLLELRILEIHSFPHFSLTPFNILSWKFAYYFVFLYYRSRLRVVNLCLFGVMPLFELRIL